LYEISTSYIEERFQLTLCFTNVFFWLAKQNNRDFIVLRFFFKDEHLLQRSLEHRPLTFLRADTAPNLRNTNARIKPLHVDQWAKKTVERTDRPRERRRGTAYADRGREGRSYRFLSPIRRIR
jgi:hypothetical protein